MSLCDLRELAVKKLFTAKDAKGTKEARTSKLSGGDEFALQF